MERRVHEDEWGNGPSGELVREWRADITARLRRVCSHLSDEDFTVLVDRMVRSRCLELARAQARR
jgi:hypothetical protein